MDVASGVFATVSLGIQLFETVQKARDFLKGIRNAPQEISTLAQKVDQLYLTIREVNTLITRQQQCAGFLCSDDLLAMALQSCCSSVEKLDLVVGGLQTKFACPQKTRRVWTSIATTRKKDEIVRLQNSIVESVSYLTTALVINSSNFTVYQAQLAKPTNKEPSDDNGELDPESGTTFKPDGVISKQAAIRQTTMTRLLTTVQMDTRLYQGFAGFLRCQTYAIFLKSDSQSDGKPLSRLSNVMINVPFLSLAIKYEYQSPFGLPRSLSFYNVIRSYSKIFDMCQSGKIQEVKKILMNERLSPFIQDEDGRTMLHHASQSNNPELCRLILGLGVDVNHTSVRGAKAISEVGGILRDPSTSDVEDTLRILAFAQDEVSSDDLRQFSRKYKSPATISHTVSLLRGLNELSRDEINDFALVLALHACSWLGLLERAPKASSLKGYTSVIKSLLHEIPKTPCGSVSRPGTRGLNYYDKGGETLLDVLFECCSETFDGHLLGRFWITLLLEEGFNVNSYLQEEEDMHAGRQYMINPTVLRTLPRYEIPRKLVFQYGNSPMVSWQWWVDPLLPGSLICNEFWNMNLHHREDWPFDDFWEMTWPFEYPDLWDHCKLWEVNSEVDEMELWHRRNRIRKDRLARRAQRKFTKQVRAQGDYRRSCMPGSWTDQ